MDNSKNLPSVTMDDILKNIYVDDLSPEVVFGNGDGGSYPNKVTGSDVWKEMVAGTGQIGGGGGAAMTLEEYLSKTPGDGGNDEAVRFGDGAVSGLRVFGDSESPSTMLSQFQQSNSGFPVREGVADGSGLVIGNGAEGRARLKRKAVQEPVVDKATQQKQKRMIKNRESAARSRERKQQYTTELEKQVLDLEEERARLLKEETEGRNHRLQWLIKNILPVEEKQKSVQRLRRTSSVEW